MAIRSHIVSEKELAHILAMRTGMDEETIETILHFYERAILHQVLRGKLIHIKGLFTIYHRDQGVEIELTEQAKRYIKKK